MNHLEEQELEYQKKNADPFRGYVGLLCVMLLIGVPIGFVIFLGWLANWMACQNLPQYCQ